MSLTPTERKKINKVNSSKSTGPKSEVGKARSRLNALKHGLRAETLALPNEDPAQLAAREQQWYDFYQPRNPGEAYLVQQAVRATIQLDRCARFQTATVSKQVRSAVERWSQRHEDAVERFVEMIGENPADAVRRLRRSSFGCRWLLEQWTELRNILEHDSRWAGADLRCAKLLGGDFSDGEWLVESPGSPCPETPERAAALREVQRELTTRIDELSAREERLRTEIDEPDRAAEAERAFMIEDVQAASLFLRYQTAAQSTFFRAYAALTKALENDRAEPADDLSDDPQPVPLPNEPKPAEESSSTPCEPKTSGETPAPDSGPPAAPEHAPSADRPSPAEPPALLIEQNLTIFDTNGPQTIPMNADQIRIL
jgi:hypothetical protein